ncbi:MAG: hypothetical protein NC253_04110 [Ruminococcus sp.]|nr:hypothetical protein [Ruminococcus sp.]MCM1380956.1 hypothetical protein [Muribaculaceae bacterium]MCM1479538.1 hypothetical protein [Muribaculaceae bacterium]
MYFKIGFILVLLTFLLTGCEKNSAEISLTETGAETVTSTETETSSVTETSAETSATSVTTVTEMSEKDVSIAKPYYIEDGEPPRVYPAEEFYDVYPEVLVYAERQDVSDKVKTEIWQENLYNSEGITAVKFYAEYPVLSGYDGEVCEKINGAVKDYINGKYEEMREYADEFLIDNEEEVRFMIANDKFWSQMSVNMDGNYFDGYGYEINGNIFTVYFAYGFGYFASAHMSEIPVPMMFDLRTGEKINFSELIGDKDKMSQVFGKALYRGGLLFGSLPNGNRNADEISEYMKPPFYTVSEDYYPDERIAAMDGCIGFFFAPYENGSFADGVRFWRLPASEFIPYMNEAGKSLFEGYVSAETRAPNVVEYKGRRWFDNTEWVPYVFERGKLTDGDREFISLFENARDAEYYLNGE